MSKKQLLNNILKNGDIIFIPYVPDLPPEAEREKVHAARAAQRKGQVGSGDRSERIRTYNQKRGTCLDHRTGIQVKIDRINCCPEPEDLDKLIDANLLKFKTEVE